MLEIVFTLFTGIGFVIATRYGIIAIVRGGPFMAATWYVTIIAAANAAFRVFTLYHRVLRYDFPQPETTRVALFLQITLAMAFVLIFSVGKMSADAVKQKG